jgi:hypothetical protein
LDLVCKFAFEAGGLILTFAGFSEGPQSPVEGRDGMAQLLFDHISLRPQLHCLFFLKNGVFNQSIIQIEVHFRRYCAFIIKSAMGVVRRCAAVQDQAKGNILSMKLRQKNRQLSRRSLKKEAMQSTNCCGSFGGKTGRIGLHEFASKNMVKLSDISPEGST